MELVLKRDCWLSAQVANLLLSALVVYALLLNVPRFKESVEAVLRTWDVPVACVITQRSVEIRYL